MDKLLPIILIFLGEALTISVEVWAAKHFSGSPGSFAWVFWRVLPIFVFGCALVVSGYMFGLVRLKNIWIVSAVSITSILFIEPLVDYFIGGQLPTRGALVGLVFGVFGFAASLFL